MRKEVLLWWEQAQKDLEVAEKNLKIEEYYVTAFFCQQAVEKALKALFILKMAKSPGQTHSLIYLGSGVGVPKELFGFLQILTPEFITTRYPDVVQEVPYKLYNNEIARSYLTNAKVLFKWIANQISKH